MSTTVETSSRRRTIAVWTVVGVVLVAVGAAGAWLSALGQYAQRDALDPDAYAPEGARAIAELLRDHGVDVEVVRTLDEAREVAAAGGTLALADTGLLDDDVLTDLADASSTFVALSLDSRALDLLFDGSEYARVAASTAVAAGCDLAVTANTGPVSPEVTFLPAGDAVGCYGDSAGGFGLLSTGADGDRRFALDGGGLVANDRLAEDGNAALAVALLGGSDRLVWFVPAADDPALATGAGLGDVTPGWVTPALVLLAVAALVAILWRGRRFGPLVAETLPVTVRASETTAGRARLYARSGDAVHAADQLRIAAAGRLARTLGLGPAATVDEIADGAASRLGADPRTVRAVLVADVPRSDRELVDLAARLGHLEAAVRAAVNPGRTRP